jgi:hypothetical protein
VGKKKEVADNATQVSFATRKIMVPAQRLQQKEATETLRICMSQICHNNESTRQDSLQNMRELFNKDQQVFVKELGLVCSSLARASIDAVHRLLSP